MVTTIIGVEFGRQLEEQTRSGLDRQRRRVPHKQRHHEEWHYKGRAEHHDRNGQDHHRVHEIRQIRQDHDVHDRHGDSVPRDWRMGWGTTAIAMVDRGRVEEPVGERESHAVLGEGWVRIAWVRVRFGSGLGMAKG